MAVWGGMVAQGTTTGGRVVSSRPRRLGIFSDTVHCFSAISFSGYVLGILSQMNALLSRKKVELLCLTGMVQLLSLATQLSVALC